MFGNGAGIGMAVVIMALVLQTIQRVLHPARTVFCVVARGAATQVTAVRAIVSAATRSTGAATSVFVYPGLNN